MARETRSAANFRRLSIQGIAEVTLAQGTTEGVSVEAAENILSYVETSVRDQTLYIVAAEDRRWWGWLSRRRRARPPRVTVHFRQIDRIDTAGAIKLAAGSLR